MRKAHTSVLLALLGVCRLASAVDGDLDIGFGFLGQVTLAPAGMDAQVPGQLQLRTDGSNRIVGCIRTLNGQSKPVPWLFRLGANGATDSSFAMTGSKFVTIPAAATGLACDGFAVAGNGKIVLASYDGSNQYIMRFKADGTPDTSFNATGTLTIPRTPSSNDFIYDAAIAADGSVYIVYSRSTVNGARFLVRHVLENGTVDMNFGPGGNGGGLTLFDGFAIRTGVTARTDDPNHVLLASDGGIIITGSTTPMATGNTDFAAARLTSTGDPDPGFGTAGARIIAFDGGQTNADRCYASALDTRGRVVMVGYAQRATAGDYDFATVRLTKTGAPDSALGGSGKIQTAFDLNGAGEDIATSVAIQSDGRILIGGYAKHVTGSSGFDWAVARLLDNGAVDGSFGAAHNGKQTYTVNLGGVNNDFLYGVVANGSDYVVGGVSTTGTTTESGVLARLRLDLVFAGDFGG